MQPSATIDKHQALIMPNSAPLCSSKTTTDDELPTAKPWVITPPLKKRPVRVAVTDDSPISLSPLKAKTTVTKKRTVHKKARKSVRFSKVIKSRTLKKERTTNLKSETKQQMWYTPREYMEMDQDSAKNVMALHQVQGNLAILPPDDYCLRGLEMKISPHIHRLRRLRASISTRAVLDQQALYCKSKVTAPEESLALVSRLYTRQASNRARELGLIDSIEAQRYR